MQQHNIVFCQESTCLTTHDQCRKGNGKLRTFDLLKFGHEHLGLSLLTGIKIRVEYDHKEWYFHVSFMLHSWASHGFIIHSKGGNKRKFKQIPIEIDLHHVGVKLLFYNRYEWLKSTYYQKRHQP